MKRFGELLQSEDWKKEKHVPVIECPDSVKSGERFEVRVSVGKEVTHPNTTEHHIRWIHLFFHPEGEKAAYQVAGCEFSAHGESAAGANEGPVHTDHTAAVVVAVKKPGTLYAVSFCNIHGFWEFSREISLS